MPWSISSQIPSSWTNIGTVLFPSFRSSYVWLLLSSIHSVSLPLVIWILNSILLLFTSIFCFDKESFKSWICTKSLVVFPNLKTTSSGAWSIPGIVWFDVSFLISSINLLIFDWSEVKIFVLPPIPVSYTHLTLPTILRRCRSRWSPYH